MLIIWLKNIVLVSLILLSLELITVVSGVDKFREMSIKEKMKMDDRYGFMNPSNQMPNLPDLDYQNIGTQNANVTEIDPNIKRLFYWDPFIPRTFKLEDEKRQLKALSNFNLEIESDLKRVLRSLEKDNELRIARSVSKKKYKDEDDPEFVKYINKKVRDRVEAIKEEVDREVNFGLLDADNDLVFRAKRVAYMPQKKEGNADKGKTEQDVSYLKKKSRPVTNITSSKKYKRMRKTDTANIRKMEYNKLKKLNEGEIFHNKFSKNEENMKINQKVWNPSPENLVENFDVGIQEILETMHSIRKRNSLLNKLFYPKRKRRSGEIMTTKMFQKGRSPTRSTYIKDLEESFPNPSSNFNLEDSLRPHVRVKRKWS